MSELLDQRKEKIAKNVANIRKILDRAGIDRPNGKNKCDICGGKIDNKDNDFCPYCYNKLS